MPLRGLALSCPLMPLADQHYHTHFKSYKLSTKNQNFINNKEAYTYLIFLLKPQTTKIIFINQEIRLTHQNHNIPSLKKFRSCIKEQLR
jgi:hypothetical protein